MEKQNIHFSKELMGFLKDVSQIILRSILPILFFLSFSLVLNLNLANSENTRSHFSEKYHLSFEYSNMWEIKEYQNEFFNDYTVSLTSNNGQINFSMGEGIEKNYRQYDDIIKIPNIKKIIENQIRSSLGEIKNIKVDFTKLANRNALVADFLFAKIADKTTIFFKVKQYILFNNRNQYTVSIKCPGLSKKEAEERFRLIENEVNLVLISFSVY
jgi:hypothetical protein